jgi:predicted esterase
MGRSATQPLYRRYNGDAGLYVGSIGFRDTGRASSERSVRLFYNTERAWQHHLGLGDAAEFHGSHRKGRETRDQLVGRRTVLDVKRRTLLLIVLTLALIGAVVGASRAGDSASTTANVLEERAGYQHLVLQRSADGEVRDIIVEVSYPTDRSTAHPVLFIGGYRNGTSNIKNDPVDSWGLTEKGAVVVRIGFPHMNEAGLDIRYRDIKNHPRDVRAVLEYVKRQAQLFGEVTDTYVWYGASMGAITGLVMNAEPEPAVQLDAMIAVGGFLPQKDQGFPSPEWDLSAMGNVTLIASQTDQTIPYQLSVRTYRELTQAGVEARLLTRKVGPHALISDCRELEQSMRSLVLTELGVGTNQSSSLGSCAVPGELPGGTSGLGLAALIAGNSPLAP